MNQYPDIDRREYGKLEAQVAQLVSDVSALEKTVRDMHDMMQQASGGWRTIMMFSGVSATIAGTASWIIAHIRYSP